MVRIVNRRRLAAAGVVLVLIAAFTAPAVAKNANPGVLPPQSRSHGKSYGEWAALWWQWALSAPTPVNPLLDQTGEDCAVGQSGHVWFLAGRVGGGSTERTCTVPVGTALFFPILNNVFIATEPSETEELVHQAVTNRVSGFDVALLEADVDGRILSDLGSYRAHSPTFAVTLPADNLFGVPAGTYGPAATDGYWLMLHPLPPGEYTVHFGGTFPNIATPLDVTYHLTVAHR